MHRENKVRAGSVTIRAARGLKSLHNGLAPRPFSNYKHITNTVFCFFCNVQIGAEELISDGNFYLHFDSMFNQLNYASLVIIINKLKRKSYPAKKAG